jgi:hypothetical protein
MADFGIIGIPLSSHEAERMQSHFTTIGVNKTTWEVDGSKAVLRNPAWSTWLNGVVNNICTALGVNAAVSHPRPLLRKLLLHVNGSQ